MNQNLLSREKGVPTQQNQKQRHVKLLPGVVKVLRYVYWHDIITLTLFYAYVT